MRTPSKSLNRPGLSLAEVLVAMFVISIGLLALLTFFPMGAAQMAQAFKDDRTGHVSTNAADQMRSIWKDVLRGRDEPPRPDAAATSGPTKYPDNTRFIAAQDLPDATDDTLPTPQTPSPTCGAPDCKNAGGPSYPVFIDPIGFNSPKSVSKWWFGGDPNLRLPRRTLPAAVLPAGNKNTIRFCTLLDDITFNQGGQPDIAGTGGAFVPRDGRYSHMWMIQRKPATSDWRASTVTVITFAGRSLDSPFTEDVYDMSVAGTQVTVNYSGGKPKFHRGGWVFLTRSPAVDWCRVVGVDDSTPNVLRLELQTVPQNVAGSGKAIAFACVSEVFQKGKLTPTRLPSAN